MSLEHLHLVEKLRQRCVAANPELNEGIECQNCMLIEENPVRLTDVLRIFDSTLIDLTMPVEMQIQLVQRKYGEIASHWNIKEDNLRKQSNRSLKDIIALLP